jgi:cytochrome c553
VSVRRLAAVVVLVTAGHAAADVELGRYLATECTTCHRAAAAGGAIPSIVGIDEARLAGALKAYRDRALPNPVMQNVAGRLTDEEIAALARYFATAAKP